jgi:large subunit ribosomal protein L22
MLYVREIFVNEGPKLKRVWFRGRGRADMQVKRMCHITVVIDEAQDSGARSTVASKKVDK